ncbi:MAG TPA: ABC transporter ATP-binding protein [Verrucomicrobiae bacterium]|nr:ABC transporter ATP-binding protein [Verrucomicrobiae bacterium]
MPGVSLAYSPKVIEFWLKLWQLTRPYKARFILGMLFGILSGFGDALLLVTIGFVVGVVFSKSADTSVTVAVAKLPAFARTAFIDAQHLVAERVSGSNAGLLFVVSLIPMAVLLRGVFAYLNSYLMGWVASRAISDLRTRIFEHLINLPLSFLSRNSTGELMSRIGDVSILQNMIGVFLVTLVREPINVILLGAVAFRVDPQLTLEALVTLPLCAIPIVIYNKKVRKSGASLQTEQAQLSRMMHESFTGIRIIKGYNMEGVVMDRFRQTQRKFISHFMRVVRATESPGPIIETLGGVGIAILLFHLAGSGRALQFGVFVGSVMMMYAPVKKVVRNQSDLHRARSATQRVFELLATKSVLVDPPNPLPLKAANAEIHFDNVSFSYGDKLVLRNVQLNVEPGQMVALVGRSGSGKTSLTNLLLRFYDPTDGAIRIGGVDLRQASTSDVRAQMAVVTQEVILFDDTIRNNIAAGRPGATDKEIEQAARHAFAHDFIMEKPHGYDSVVGEKGTNLSGGQRQRIAIARAILKDAPILVLDEATSALDTEAERVVQAALDELMKGRTTICIAHRLTTIQHADRIIVMENGEIVESGKHAELLLGKGVYQKLHALGFSD